MQSRILRRWINSAFQTPSSNSRIMSTTSIGKKSKPNIESLSEKAFCSQLDRVGIRQAVYKTYRSWNPWLFLQYIFNTGTINGIILFIYQLSCSSNGTLAAPVIDTGKGHSLRHISCHSKVMHSSQRNKTSGTGATTQVPNAGQKNSVYI